jgi:hypothetical protein
MSVGSVGAVHDAQPHGYTARVCILQHALEREEVAAADKVPGLHLRPRRGDLLSQLALDGPPGLPAHTWPQYGCRGLPRLYDPCFHSGTVGSNPLSSSGESRANLTSRMGGILDHAGPAVISNPKNSNSAVPKVFST